jgi:hypothetical protein
MNYDYIIVGRRWLRARQPAERGSADAGVAVEAGGSDDAS